MTFKFELGQLVVHKTSQKDTYWPIEPTRFLILGRACLESQDAKEELYLVAYQSKEGHIYKHYLFEQELQALKTEENDR